MKQRLGHVDVMGEAPGRSKCRAKALRQECRRKSQEVSALGAE